MPIDTLLYIIGSGIVALALAGFQYYTNKKSMSKLHMLFLFLRFITIFSILLLIVNPKFQQVTISTQKPNLVLAIDNSNSIDYLKQREYSKKIIDTLISNKKLQSKFNIETYTFGEVVKASNHVTFDEKQTNIDQTFQQLSQIYKETISPTVIITDGNQTYGNDYEFAYATYKQPIYPVILGDTIKHVDLKIQQLNVNKYAFLKNQFPVETIVVYNGETPINTRFVVTNGATVVYSEALNFNKTNNSKIINFKLPANSVGVHVYKAYVEALPNEKNTINNIKNFAVDVIDQKTKIALVSDLLHPDLGAFKKSIEANEQRSVTFFNTNDVLSQINDFQLVILYQPNSKFNKLLDVLQTQNKNSLTVIGTKTDLKFVNSVAKHYTYDITNQTESYQAALNQSFAPYLVDDINFESFPPLQSPYGTAQFSVPYETLLHKTVNGLLKNDPLLATFETNGRREAVLFGENIWQWRAHSYLKSKSFQDFDNFLGKLMQYLASNKPKSRLNLEYESFYNGHTNVIVKAEFFDKNFNFDARETLNIKVTDVISKKTSTFPLILNTNNYQVDLSNLPASDYTFTVSATKEKISKSGTFKILEYNVEQQFLNADVTKLQQLATNSTGVYVFADGVSKLTNNLLADKRFVTLQKSHKQQLPLVDWKYLLIIIALSLAIEWFLRKYNGLI